MDPFVRLILAEGYAFLTDIAGATALAMQTNNSPQLSLNPLELARTMSWAGLGVMIVLLIMSMYSIAVMLERYLTFSSAAKQSREFAPRVGEMLRTAKASGRLDDAIKLSQNYRRSHLAVVVNSGLQELAAQQSGKSNLQMRKAKRAVRRAATMKIAELQRGLSSLATVGSTAPFVGLFGTVIGIIDSFHKMNQQESSGFSAIAGGISEALVATAFGLLVAIPAVWTYNYFTSRVSRFAVEMQNSADELVDYFLQQEEAK
ncbi:MAG TPA: MotA/TolQ/ExbB proton channel family protein [Blastocatellia bacterium]|nr:MotA/TolQ/ExbB proton channel family protein [Blastocatellia bacterium]HMV83596.1 MotA/TolQ/ExbB proton channel family protein [Blastocatellia bacterium]HMX26596.1 MotA/TolQ/ExbB proton channel family protein [Blastocatellia bacterium]HMY70767.1 MotA/TolQ/ExbB proton channel family protein [Blastocatellia bacterium]HMZ22138.1 MotA/TolQ/ExbB proton channel family protein [Blastocatellia bacterium]